MSNNNVQNYHQQGGAVWVVGARLDLNGSWYINGIQVTATAAQLNAIDAVSTVANKTGGDLAVGTLVYISGYDTTLDAITVTEADADDATKKATLVLTEAIVNNASGTAESEGVITALNTSSYSAVGSLVYESTTAGESTPTPPTDANDDRRVVGVVKVKDAAVGEIYFFPGRGGLEHAAVYMNNITPGTMKASGAVIADANINIGIVKSTELHIGASGSEVQVTSTPAELNYLDITAIGTQEASKAVVADANVNTGISKITELHIGATGAEVQISSSAAELNLLDRLDQSEIIDSGVAVSATKRITNIDNTASGAGAITLAVPDATMIGQVKVIEFKVDNGDVTLSLANVQGGSAATTCTWSNAGEVLVLVAGVLKWNVVSEGGVVLT